MWPRRPACAAIISSSFRASRGSSSGPRRSSVSAAPKIAAVGVRSSCETVATKSLFSSSRRRSFVTSRNA